PTCEDFGEPELPVERASLGSDTFHDLGSRAGLLAWGPPRSVQAALQQPLQLVEPVASRGHQPGMLERPKPKRTPIVHHRREPLPGSRWLRQTLRELLTFFDRPIPSALGRLGLPPDPHWLPKLVEHLAAHRRVLFPEHVDAIGKALEALNLLGRVRLAERPAPLAEAFGFFGFELGGD